jgi:hypothetical protein
VWDEDKAVGVSSLPIASANINDLMPRLLAALQGHPTLARGLGAISFLVSEGRMHRRWLRAWIATRSVTFMRDIYASKSG